MPLKQQSISWTSTVKPERVAAALVSVCGRSRSLSLGKTIHAYAIVRSIINDSILLLTSLVDMYTKCADVGSGLKLFRSMRERNVVSWTAMVNGFAINRRHDLAIDLFKRMVVENVVKPNRATLLAVLPACAESGGYKLIKQIHGIVFRQGFESESRVIGSLICTYSKCTRGGGLKLAMQVFDTAEERDAITWSSIMAATSRAPGYAAKTFQLFRRMKRQDDAAEPNHVTMLALLDACVSLESLDHGRAVLSYIVKSGFLPNTVLGNSLINMFSKCGCIDSACRVFCMMMPVNDSISCSTMIQSYGLHGRGHEALRLFRCMQEARYECDWIAMLAVLSACNHSGLVDEGVKLFGEYRGELSSEHYACYVDLLARNGRIQEACEVARRMPMEALSSRVLSSLVSACRVHGEFEMAKELGGEIVEREPENAANYALLSLVCGFEGSWQRLEEVRRLMRGRGLRKNLACSRVLITF